MAARRKVVAIVDYGMGNLRSVEKSFQRLGAEVEVTSDPRQIRSAGRVVVPGVGAFGNAMAELGRRQLTGVLNDLVRGGTPLLGVCLGLQILFAKSAEDQERQGLGVLGGEVKRFGGGVKVPHVGWNQLEPVIGPNGQPRCPLLAGVPAGTFVYFVHSYYAEPLEEALVGAWTTYGQRFASVVWRGPLFATQFHPEKSQDEGMQILKNFLAV